MSGEWREGLSEYHGNREGGILSLIGLNAWRGRDSQGEGWSRAGGGTGFWRLPLSKCSYL